MRISIGNDHAGTEYKQEIVKILKKKGHEIINNGKRDLVGGTRSLHYVSLENLDLSNLNLNPNSHIYGNFNPLTFTRSVEPSIS